MEESGKRISGFDSLRGLAIVSMVAFHTVYDLVYIYGMDVSWFADPFYQSLWRDSISWTFLVLAGMMCSFSHDNLRRALKYLLVACLIWVTTTVAAVDTSINFGIIFCMGASTLVYWAGNRQMKRINPFIGVLAFVALFLLCYNVPKSYYSFSGLEWLGFPSPTFSSGDYYPVIPFTFLYLAGAYLGSCFKTAYQNGKFKFFANWNLPVFHVLGRHSLLIYLVHQPFVLIALQLLGL